MSLSDKWIDFICKRVKNSRTRTLLSPMGAILYWVVLGLFIFVSLRLDKFFRLSNPFPPLLSIVVSVPIFALGFSLPLWSVFYFIKTRGLSVLFNPPSKLITAGPYAYSRNPMVAGIIMLLLGLGVLLRSASLVFVFTPLFLLLNVLELRVIEEPELEKRFGSEYLEYKKKVPRFFLKYQQANLDRSDYDLVSSLKKLARSDFRFQILDLLPTGHYVKRQDEENMGHDRKIYRDLQKHLDRLPSGFPAMESGVEIRLLKHLFTPEEATMAAQLSMKPEPLRRIYKRIKKSGMSIEELQQLLDRMVYKGTVLEREEGYDEKRYSNAGLSAGGIFDFQVNRLTKDLVNDFTQYLHERFDTPRPPGKKPPPKRILPLRTIPIEKSIPLPEKYRINIYDDVRKLVENARGQIAVANCVCRQTKDLLGQSCRHTHLRETCLMIGPDQAKHYIGMGIGRPITKEEALDILKKVQESGLILQPENSQRPEAICCCCGDCCELLAMTKRFPRPADIYVTNYFLEVDTRLCKGCKKCIERCQLEARVMVNGVSRVNLDRCIGCGNCVVVCESNASRLHKKERELVLSKDKEAFERMVLSNQLGKWNMLKLRIKTLLGLRV